MLIWLLLTLAWMPRASVTDAGLRGVCAVSDKIVWASGTKGTWLRTTDGGTHWQAGTVSGAADLDFRDVQGWSERDAVLMGSGTEKKSRVYGTTDGGKQWRLLFTNPDKDGFFDAFAFWSRENGILLGDPVGGHFVIFVTTDGGETWQRREGPSALDKEGAFAASGTCLFTYGSHDVWFGTGGGETARVFHSVDRGSTWAVSTTPLNAGIASAGVFSLAFADKRHGVAVGGNYKQADQANGSLAMTDDGGVTWRVPAQGRLGGYRSAVISLPGRRGGFLAVGPSGSDISTDGGLRWQPIPVLNLNAVAAARTGNVWAVGAAGVLQKLSGMD